MDDRVGCRIQLNPNGSDLRCGDRINNINWNLNEGVVQLCEVCKIKQRNLNLVKALKEKYSNDQ